MKNFKKAWFNSLSFLDNCTVHAVIVIILLLYSSTIFDNINSYVGRLYNSNIVKVIVLLLIIYVSPKDTTIAVLLAISYMVSLSYMSNMENFASNNGPVQTAMQQAPTMKANMQQKASSHMTAEEQNMIASKKQNLKNKVTTEHFFPLPSVNESEFKQKNNSNKQQPVQKMNNNENVESCMNLYTPKFEAVGNVCAPTATFQNELNAQGLNSPEGFDSMVVGAPLQ